MSDTQFSVSPRSYGHAPSSAIPELQRAEFKDKDKVVRTLAAQAIKAITMDRSSGPEGKW